MDSLGEYWEKLVPGRLRGHLKWWLPVVIGLAGGIPGILLLMDKWGINLAGWVWTLLLVLILATLNIRQYSVWRREARRAERAEAALKRSPGRGASPSVSEVVTPEEVGPELETDKLQEGLWAPYFPTWQDEEYRRGEEAKRALRERRGLEPLSEFQEGLAASDVAPGTYAFAFPSSLNTKGTWSAVFAMLGSDRPSGVAADQIQLNAHVGRVQGSMLEVHRVASGEVELIGFVSLQDKHKVSGATGGKISLFTRRTQRVTELVSVPLRRLTSCRCHDIRETSHRLDIELAALETIESDP